MPRGNAEELAALHREEHLEELVHGLQKKRSGEGQANHLVALPDPGLQKKRNEEDPPNHPNKRGPFSF